MFLSTTEPVDCYGNTTNPTKSPCDPYVFNTVLTRSKSLVVAVGSPLALLGIEKHIKARYGTSKEAKCWSSYLKLCLEKGTFIIPPMVEPSEVKAKEYEKMLRSMVFEESTASCMFKVILSSDLSLGRIMQVECIVRECGSTPYVRMSG